MRRTGWIGPLAVVLAGCQGSSAPPPPLTPRGFCEALQREECIRAAACCDPGSRFSLEICMKVAGRGCSDELPRGHLFDGAAAATCASAEGQRYLGCGWRHGDDPVFLGLKKTCAGVYPPARHEGDECWAHSQCAAPAPHIGFCEGVDASSDEPRPEDVHFLLPQEWPAQATSSGLRQTIALALPPPKHFCAAGTTAGAGEHCQAGLCTAGLFCSRDDVCVRPLPDGAPCDAYGQCASGICHCPPDGPCGPADYRCLPWDQPPRIYTAEQCQVLSILDARAVTTDGIAGREQAHLVADRSHVYWIDGHTIRRAPVGGGRSELIFVGDDKLRRPHQLLVDDAFVYWVSVAFVGRVPRASGTPAVPEVVDLRAPADPWGPGPVSMALDGDSLWLATEGCDSVARLSKRFDQLLSLPRGTGERAVVAVGAGRVFCGSQWTFVSLDPASGARTTLTFKERMYHLAAEGDRAWVGTTDAPYDHSKLWRVTIAPDGARAEQVAVISPRLNTLAVDAGRARLFWANDQGLWTSPTANVVPAPMLEAVTAAAMADDGGDRIYWMVGSPFGRDAVEGITWLLKP